MVLPNRYFYCIQVIERLDSALGGGAFRYGDVLFKNKISKFNPVEMGDCPDFMAIKYVPLSDIFCNIGVINFTSAPTDCDAFSEFWAKPIFGNENMIAIVITVKM